MAQILDMIVDNLSTWLNTKMIDDLAVSSPSIANMVRVGRFQDDPVENAIHILIHSGDPEDEKWEHGLVTAKDRDEIGIGYLPPQEIGGGSLWWRRISAQVGCFFVNQSYTRDQAREYAHQVLGRLELNIANCTTIVGLTDEFGESSIKTFVVRSRFQEGGGPDTSWIWRGKVWAQTLCDRPN